jgi:hypothetical protein
MKKLIILLICFLIGVSPVIVNGWVGSEAVARLFYPASMYYETTPDWILRTEPLGTQRVWTKADVWIIAYNEAQGIWKAEMYLEDTTTHDSSMIHSDETIDNKQEPQKLNQILESADMVLLREYILYAKIFDLNGDAFTDTTLVQRRPDGWWMSR